MSMQVSDSNQTGASGKALNEQTNSRRHSSIDNSSMPASRYEVDLKRISVGNRHALGLLGLCLWLFFFSGGILLETIEERAFLAPHAFPNRADKEKAAGFIMKPYGGTVFSAFITATLWFTPTNLAILTILAGLIGGCTSNITYATLTAEDAAELPAGSKKYLAEAPWSAMMRSFVVYLCVIAGLYFALEDPFKESTPAQYMRLAGTVSVLGFLVGYDPSRISAWIGMIPTPRPPQDLVARQKADTTIKTPNSEIHQSFEKIVSSHESESSSGNKTQQNDEKNAHAP